MSLDLGSTLTNTGAVVVSRGRNRFANRSIAFRHNHANLSSQSWPKQRQRGEPTGVSIMVDPNPDASSDLITGDAAAAYSAQVNALHSAALEIARIKRESFPGLLEAVESEVVVVISAGSRRKLGHFACSAWQLGPRSVSEIWINADRRWGHETGARSEDVLVTLIHELVHLWNTITGVTGTSNRGRYHNRRFAEAALEAGLEVEYHSVAQHVTPRLQPVATSSYSEVLSNLNRALVLERRPRMVDTTGITAAAPAGATGSGAVTTAANGAAAGREKYVSAQCGCQDSRGRRRTLRMAAGWWPRGEITCGTCGQAFAPDAASPS